MILSIFTSIYIVISTIGFFIARWTIKQYNKVPHYNYDNNTQKVIYSSRALNQLDSSSSNNTPTNELFQNNNDANNNQEQDSKLQTRLPQYSGINPFTIKKLSNYEKFKIYLFCISGIALIRMILFFGCAVGLYLISLPITICFSPNSFMHTQLVRFIRYFIGCALFLFGFYYIDFSDQTGLSSNKNKEKDEDEPIRVIVANHSTVFDGMVILWRTNGIIAAKKEISKAPIFGRILNALQTLWIDRSGSKGRNYAKQQIINHVNDHKAPPLIIFPQGTCSNVHTVTSFKAGINFYKKNILCIAELRSFTLFFIRISDFV